MATRLAVRVPAKSGAVAVDTSAGVVPLDRNGTDYLSWLFAFKGEGYEYGGDWFGGCESPTVRRAYSRDTSKQYGIDCGGLISCGAYFAGYDWTPRYNTTKDLGAVSHHVGWDGVRPGDILLWYGHHVMSVCGVHRRDRGLFVDTIEAAGSDVGMVVYRQNRYWKKLRQYDPRGLLAP